MATQMQLVVFLEGNHMATLVLWSRDNREEKSLRHVAMVAKFLDDNKPKRHLKSGFALFKTSSILFNFI